jgi:parvulin-like peptidyl-prolyl isomerase
MTAILVAVSMRVCIADPSGETLATVNGSAITRADMVMETACLAEEMSVRNHPLSTQAVALLEDRLLDNLIDRELLFQEAREKNMQIRDRWIERTLAELKNRAGSEARYKAFLQRSQSSEEQFRERLRKGLIVRRFLRREVVRGIKVSETEMQAFYRQNPDYFIRREQARFRHILIKADADAEPGRRGEALLKIQSIQEELKAGASFGAVAIEQSEDGSRINGGDIGIVERHQLVPELAEIAFALSPGQISDIIETEHGYHLIQMVAQIPTSTMAYRNARTKIERTLRRNKEKAAAEKFLGRLRAKSVITRPSD